MLYQVRKWCDVTYILLECLAFRLNGLEASFFSFHGILKDFEKTYSLRANQVEYSKFQLSLNSVTETRIKKRLGEKCLLLCVQSLLP